MSAVALVGLPGAGKSAVGPLLAERLGRTWVDLDAVVAAEAGKPVAELIRREGEASFRIRESAALRQCVQRPDVVLATGGGAPCWHDGMAVLTAQARVVWLDASPEVLAERTLRDDRERPLLGGTRADHEDALRTLAAERTPTYARAHLRVDAGRPASQVAEAIALALEPAEAIAAPHGVWLHGGGIADAAATIAELAAPSPQAAPLAVAPQAVRLALVVDDAVAAEAAPLAAMLAARGLTVARLDLTGGERAKDVRQLARVWRFLAEAGLDRHDLLVAVGGGAVTDLAGFAAATYLRGIRWVAMPTTLLGMADAAVGGKTAIDLPEGKNLAGAFHPPELAWLALGALGSLPAREFRSGLAEIAKIFAVFDADAWRRLRSDAEGLRKRHLNVLRPHLRRAVALKAEVVAADPREQAHLQPDGRLARALLNFGHTFGHAIEATSQLRHGEAVALGMVAVVEACVAHEWAPPELAREVRSTLAELGLPTDWEQHAHEGMWTLVERDKKRQGDAITLVALTGLGAGVLKSCRLAPLLAMMQALGMRAPRGSTLPTSRAAPRRGRTG
jgi:3-dehydroquinate synthase